MEDIGTSCTNWDNTNGLKRIGTAGDNPTKLGVHSPLKRKPNDFDFNTH